MKVLDILTEDQQRLDEISFKQGLRAGAMIGAMALPSMINTQYQEPPPNIPKTVQSKQVNPKFEQLATEIARTYKCDPKLALEVVELAHKHADPVFPTAQDIIHLIGVESSFNPTAVSGLKKDPAYGLTQIRPETNGLTRADLQTPEAQIIHGVKKLKHYFNRLKGDKNATLQAYNIGLKNYLRGKKAPKYIKKFDVEQQRYASIDDRLRI